MHPAAASRLSRMSRVDTVWLRMDNPVNLMMIVGVWLLEPGVALAALRERVTDTLLRYERFGQKVVQADDGPHWVEDERFDIARHVVAERLKPARGQSAVQALKDRCGDLATTPLPADRPLWQFHLVERFGGGSALIARIHHCIGDGIALISVMDAITDGGRPPPEVVFERSASLSPHGHEHDWIVDHVLRPLTDAAVKAVDMTGDGVVRGMDAMAHPAGSLLGSIDVARSGMKLVSDIGALAFMPNDTPTRLKAAADRPLAGRKRVAWAEPMPLDDVKAVGRALGCSVNDVLLACVSGAIGDWLRGQGDEPEGAEIRAMVPVNLRPPELAWQLGNRFGLAPLLLPVGIANPIERVFAVHARMAMLKDSWQPLMSYGLLAAAGFLSKPMQDMALGLFADKATAVMTNVPGPRTPLRLCGAELKQTMFWVPASGNVGVGVSILSYAGGVQFGLITDEALCDAPQAVIDRVAVAVDELLWLTLMLPWGAD